jgi:phosphate transport system substrate-binding protein
LVYLEDTEPGLLKGHNTIMQRIVYSFCLFLILYSCSEVEKDSYQKQIQSITALVDPSWSSLVKAYQTTYNALNTNTNVIVQDTAEAYALQQFFKGNSSLVFVSHPLDSSVIISLIKQKKFIRIDTIGYDAVACIAPQSMDIDSLSLTDLRAIFLGANDRKIKHIYMNGAGTSVLSFLEENFGKPLTKSHLFSAGSDEQLIDKIAHSNNTIGLVSSKSFSNLASNKTKLQLKKVKLIPIYEGTGNAFYPDQSSLYTGEYPLKRTLYALLYDRVDGLGTAFVNFMLSERGQRLILKEGLLPHHMPSRKVSLE